MVYIESLLFQFKNRTFIADYHEAIIVNVKSYKYTHNIKSFKDWLRLTVIEIAYYR